MYTDETIKTNVVNQMRWDNRIDASNVQVSVDQGQVTLSGTVPTYTARQAAADDTWLVNGVKSITNNLTIKYPESISLPSDEEIRSNVESVLLWNTDLASYRMDVSVESGQVTLEGTVDTLWEKIQAEDEAWSIQGVIDVTNKLAVVPSEKIADEIIGKEVVNAIDRNLTVDVDKVTVTVDEGEVTLTGTVPTTTAKTAAYRSALYTWGVTEVDNNIMVDYIT